MNEAALLRRIKAGSKGLVLGIGDDAAIFRPRPGQDLVFTTDLFIEGVHFRPEALTAAEIGSRALARSLSDIAAMGAKPRLCLVSLALAPWTDDRWFAAFFRGLLALARKHGVTLAGGDLSHLSKVVCDVMVCGEVPKGKALRRGGAHPGDIIYVSGPLGGWRHRPHIEPRLALGRKLIGKATAAMDISDGLALDLHRLCLASKAAAALDREPPRLPGATLDQALHDGEDYELLYTAPGGLRVPGHPIGSIVEGKPGRITLLGKRLPPSGYDHFASHHRS